MEVKKIGNIYGFTGGDYAGNTYSTDGLCPAFNRMDGGNRQPMIVAMRGRNPDRPTCRESGLPTEQRLEPNHEGICNSLTTVQKDNLVMEKLLIKENTAKGYSECEVGGVADLSYPDSTTRRGRVQGGGQICPGFTVTDMGNIKRIEVNEDDSEIEYRIRKLTPLECWRLMGFTDEEFKAAEAVNSNTQLYKQAGNSIVVDVLVALFGNILDSLEDAEDTKDKEDIRMENMKTSDNVEVISANQMIDLFAFYQKEPDLYKELAADYPADKKTYVICVE